MNAIDQSTSVENGRSARRAYAVPAVLMVLCALGVLSTILAGFHFIESAERAQTLASNRWIAFLSDFQLEHFYKIQKEQLELRLNELAIREDLDDLVRENYRLRIAEYAIQMETVHKKSAQMENEAHAYELERDRNQRRTRWLMAGAAGFVLAITLLALQVLADIRGFLAAAVILLIAALAICANAFISFWR
ncbi:MAG: DUF4337 family protein [Terriglobia bacterium]